MKSECDIEHCMFGSKNMFTGNKLSNFFGFKLTF